MKKIKGFGDVIHIITTFTGIKWVVKKIWGKDCGCDQRREKINVKLPLNGG